MDEDFGRFFNVLDEDKVDDAEAVDKLLDFVVDENNSELSKERFRFAEDAVGVANGLLDLIDRVFFLYVV